ncbi:MAG: Transcription-repair-coupling factor [Parcubacteria group bacterium GW2011_GWA2_33_14]|nr:MAG: Transcription-repair-coupling factor [Parcubacteria group bacterium GW2011_GWA2_33_14]
MAQDKSLNKLLIVSITPYFLEKQVFWFDENLDEILQSTKTQSFFQDNTIFLKKGQSHNLSGLLRKLDEMGYERVFTIQAPGEFSQKGGVIDIFPINTNQAMRLDFLGNNIENIQPLNIKVENEQNAKDILKKKLKSQKLFSDLKNIKPDDYLVHLDHGVAKFSGMEKIKDHEYYVLEYAQNDKLFVPLGLERKLSRYVGFSNPVVSRLGSALWQNTKRKIKEDVEKLAKELLDLYAKKENITRSSYINDNELENELTTSFLYQETPDQIQAIEDIKNDLAKDKPMDRIVCGDVGFGKTEVAIRTAFLAGINNRQTAIICPTTILANQHFNNFKKRFGALPFNISLISRLQTKKEQKKIIKEVKEGNIDILIGTHRILSADIEFKNLQLLIIDDEQRFGVKQKEKLRQKNPSLDILSLSATPIPRTIYLALSSFKNISLMQTPPQGRSAINTNILPYNKKIIQQAIHFELQRNGQVYFLHNKIQTIEKTKSDLEKLVPEATISYIHGRMDEKEFRFAQCKYHYHRRCFAPWTFPGIPNKRKSGKIPH